MNIGFLGMGNMAQAIAKGWIERDLVRAGEIVAYAPHQDRLKENALRIGFRAVSSAAEAVQRSDVVIIACKPYQIHDLLQEVGFELVGKQLWSIAAGWKNSDFNREFIELGLPVNEASNAKFGWYTPVRVQCIMPNTPAMIGEGVFLFEEDNSLRPEELEVMKHLFAGLGMVVLLPSKLMDIGGYISGCGPAFVDIFMEAYADAAVKYGVPRAAAYQLVGQTVLGSAKLMLETGDHPGVLKDAVCSPNGTTICGVAALEKAGFRSACIESIDAIVNKKKG
ncbi:MAG: pyrroline-5-carboxylate reductase [Lachnospiraceae bacterium]|nr:pyrroline-5-carboxylate reductase [Lachnospiraceae bacterium]